MPIDQIKVDRYGVASVLGRWILFLFSFCYQCFISRITSWCSGLRATHTCTCRHNLGPNIHVCGLGEEPGGRRENPRTHNNKPTGTWPKILAVRGREWTRPPMLFQSSLQLRAAWFGTLNCTPFFLFCFQEVKEVFVRLRRWGSLSPSEFNSDPLATSLCLLRALA